MVKYQYKMKLGAVKGVLLCVIGVVYAAMKEVDENSAVIIRCGLNGQFPRWTGPSELANPLTDGQTIKEPSMEWVNNKDLRIARAMLKHDGIYTCSDSNGNRMTAEVDVQYFSSSATISTASPENTTAVFTCYCHSNPPCKIKPFTVSHSTSSNTPTRTVFNPCEPDTAFENRMKCSVVATVGMNKEHNGLRENRCEFMYKDTQKTTISPRNMFYFPPTYVNITAVKDDKNTLTLNCSTDSSNPVALLNWYKGDKDVASDNPLLTQNERSIVDAEYYGKNVSEILKMTVDDIKDEEKAFCCAKQLRTEICDSIPLSQFRDTSGGYILTAWMTLVFVGVAVSIL